MARLSVLFLLWGVPLLNATGRLRSFHLIDTTMSINEARNACRKNYTDLATIYNEEENKELVNILNNSQSDENSGWINASSCKWSNGYSVTFTNYSGTFNITEENCCGAINTKGRWECFKCTSTKMYFMCHYQDPGQQSYNYSLIIQSKNWTEAQLSCRKNHTDLVTISNETLNDLVKEAVNGRDSFSIGLQYNHSLYWLDGGHSNCTDDIQLKKKGCFPYLSIQPYVLWFKINVQNCYALCYKSFIHVSENKMSWEEALDFCNSNYSGLLSIQSENDQIETERELKSRNISGPVWVGLRQSRLFGFWIWTNGLNMGNWTNWKGGSQPKHQISEHCGAIEKEADGQYKWSDKDCRINLRVLCERK
ncbi:macrophage mannose receptor 1-like [Pseudorasbora parva]|uniref:macrophage mannose receptor 1-like n=1 Tax=Pseudorasbora parva TaxID=51549 RepID=UPI00351EED8C